MRALMLGTLPPCPVRFGAWGGVGLCVRFRGRLAKGRQNAQRVYITLKCVGK